jgi:hypothetical protein
MLTLVYIYMTRLNLAPWSTACAAGEVSAGTFFLITKTSGSCCGDREFVDADHDDHDHDQRGCTVIRQRLGPFI